MKEIEGATGPVNVKELARKVGVEESALMGMLEFLERKGKLEIYRPATCDGSGAVTCEACVFGRGCARKKGGS